MAKIVYHMGTGTYFGLDDDVYIIDTDVVPEVLTADLMDEQGDEIALQWGQKVQNIAVIEGA